MVGRSRLPGTKPNRKLIHVVANPHSGHGQGHDTIKQKIIRLLREAFPASEVDGADIRIFLTQDMKDVDAAREQIRVHRPDFLVIIGGDGTVQTTLGKDEALLQYLTANQRPPQVVIISLGTWNTIGKTLNVCPRQPIKAVETFIKKVRRNDPFDTVNRRILWVNDKFAMIVGFGLAARFIAKYNEKSPRGFKRALVTMLWALWNQLLCHLPFSKRRSIAEPFDVQWTFESDDVVLAEETGTATGLIASSLEQVGMHIKATYLAEKEVGHFHAVLSNLGFWGTALNLPNMFFGRRLWWDVHDAPVTAARFRFSEPMVYMLDGEMQPPAEEIVIRSGPVITFIRLTP